MQDVTKPPLGAAQDAVRTWGNVLITIVVVCLGGFSCGVAMLHGDLVAGLAGLALSGLLLSLWIGAMIMCVLNRHALAPWRIVLVLALPPVAWVGTLQMISTYPYFANKTYFNRHRSDYEEAVARVRSSGSSVLPTSLKRLSVDGNCYAVADAKGKVVRYDFIVGQGFMSEGPVISFVPDHSIEAQVGEVEEVLGDGWYLWSGASLD